MEKIDLNNISLSYETKGKGSDVLLLHGFPSNMYMWNEIKNELIEKGYRVTIIEQRGYPLSRLENFDLHSFNIEELSKDIEELISSIIADGLLLKRPPQIVLDCFCLLYTSPSPRDGRISRMPSSA